MGGRCGRYVNIYQKEFVSWHSAQFHAIKYVLKKLKSHGPCAEVIYNPSFSSIQFSSVAQSCPTICNPMDCSTPGFPIHHQLPEFTQTHVHQVSDAIQPSHPLLSPFSSSLQSFPALGSFPMNQFFTSGGQSIGVSASASVLPMNIQD